MAPAKKTASKKSTAKKTTAKKSTTKKRPTATNVRTLDQYSKPKSTAKKTPAKSPAKTARKPPATTITRISRPVGASPKYGNDWIKVQKGKKVQEMPLDSKGHVPKEFIRDKFNDPYCGVRNGRKKRSPGLDGRCVNGKVIKGDVTPKKAFSYLNDPSRMDMENIDVPSGRSGVPTRR